jgi:hypothetical protein
MQGNAKASADVPPRLRKQLSQTDGRRAKERTGSTPLARLKPYRACCGSCQYRSATVSQVVVGRDVRAPFPGLSPAEVPFSVAIGSKYAFALK